jgi:hypothetical protein
VNRSGFVRPNYGVVAWHPGAGLTGALAVTVENDAETNGIDIRYSGDNGQTVSGTLVRENQPGAPNQNFSTQVGLFNPARHTFEQIVRVESGNRFVFLDVAEGEYDVLPAGNEHWAAPVRVKVKDAEVTGVVLKIAPLGMLTGRVMIESEGACRKSPLAQAEISVAPERLDASVGDDWRERGVQFFGRWAPSPAADGTFNLHYLWPGRYALRFGLPGGWYVKAVEREIAAEREPAAPSDKSAKGAQRESVFAAAHFGVSLKQGETLSGLTVAIAGGAASLRGLVESKTPLPQQLLVHLVPADAAWANDLLRYDEAVVGDGRFAFANLAPGKYWLLAQPYEEGAGKAVWDQEARLKLRKAAETAWQMIELKACQEVRDGRVRLATP